MNNVIRLEGDRENLLGLLRLFCLRNKVIIRLFMARCIYYCRFCDATSLRRQSPKQSGKQNTGPFPAAFLALAMKGCNKLRCNLMVIIVQMFCCLNKVIIRLLTYTIISLTLLKTLFPPYLNNKTTLIAQRYNPLPQTLLPYFQYNINPRRPAQSASSAFNKTKN